MSLAVENARAPHQTSRLAERRARLYLGAFLFLPLLAYVFPFFAERLPALKPLSATAGGSALDFGHQLAGQNAGVVFFGDSTIMFGTDAARMSRELGVKVLDIPNSLGSLANTDDWALREYLATNKPPRLIVFQVAPWDMDYRNLPNLAFFEGDEEILRHADLHEFLHFFAHHASEVFEFPFRFYATDTGLTSVHGFGRPRYAPVIQGFRSIDSRKTLEAGCDFPEIEKTADGTTSVRDLLKKYSTAQTRTLLYLSPIPACRGAKVIAGRTYPGLQVAPPVILPPDEMNADFAHAHPVAPFNVQTTEIVTAVVKKALAQ